MGSRRLKELPTNPSVGDLPNPDDSVPAWDDHRFKAIDDSLRTLLFQLGKAVVGMFVAFSASHIVSRSLLHLGDNAAGFVVNGLVFCLFGCIGIFVTSALPIRKAISEQRLVIAHHERSLRTRATRRELAAEIQDALEMADTEETAHGTIGRAIAALWTGEGELLLADSSRAHLREVAIAPAGSPGCTVSTPWSCPAVRRGQSLYFADDTTIAACPHLRDRGGDTGCSALCVPVVVLGTPAGVLHVTGERGAPRPDDAVLAMEALAAQAGSRIGVLRAMSSSQRQASTDPLTGRLNRRSLEDELRRLRADETPFVLAMADLDHFKNVNDTYGHETGDRALRLFSQLAVSSLREHDLVSRYGGEEFIFVLPNVDVERAAPVLHRLRERLAQAVESGRIPAFTASYGVVESDQSDDIGELIRLADRAMYQAKQEGRDRIVISAEASTSHVFAVAGPPARVVSVSDADA